MSKPRSDSKLDPLREEIFPRMKAGESYNALALWLLTEHGVDTSAAALSNAWKKWSRDDLEERVIKSKGLADDVLDLIDNPEQLDDALALAMKQSAFELVMQGGDPKTVKSFCTILLNSEKLKHDQAALDLKLRQYEDQISAAQKATENAEKGGGLTLEALREIKAALRM
jgi:hypothetical protein